MYKIYRQHEITGKVEVIASRDTSDEACIVVANYAQTRPGFIYYYLKEESTNECSL